MDNMSCQISCPRCHKTLLSKNKERYCYDPIIYVEEIIYHCPQCKYEKKVETLGELEIFKNNKTQQNLFLY
ncbi:MAG: hypothetical protein GYA02_11675 [Clostridiaceae bacterium]|jgi:DNA-directed RNA polymerase subunit M/transcription elongation factor TFIIS|nr:hypothetical protein [Clostridiaceae bacterium]